MKKKVFLSFAALTAAFTMNAQSKLPVFTEKQDIGQPHKAEFVKPAKVRGAAFSDVSLYYEANHHRHTKELLDLVAEKGSINYYNSTTPVVFDSSSFFSYLVQPRLMGTTPYWQKLTQGIPVSAPISLTDLGFFAYSANAGGTSNVVVTVFAKDGTTVLGSTTVNMDDKFNWRKATFSTPIQTSDSIYVTFDMATSTDKFRLAYSNNYFTKSQPRVNSTTGAPNWDIKNFFEGTPYNVNYDYISPMPFNGDGMIWASKVNTTGAGLVYPDNLLGGIRWNFDFMVYPYIGYDFSAPFTASKTTTCAGDNVTFSTPENGLAKNPVFNFIRWDELANAGDAAYTNYQVGEGSKSYEIPFSKSIAFNTVGNFTVKAKGMMWPWTAQALLEDETILNITVGKSAGTITGADAVCVGSKTQLTASVAGGTWGRVSGVSFSSLSATGQLTGLAAGPVVVKYTITGAAAGCPSVATKSVTVNAMPATAGSITGSSWVCKTGGAIKLTPSVAGGTWTSLKPSIASVDNEGNVTGLKRTTSLVAGVLSYTVSTPQGCSRTILRNLGVDSTPVAPAIVGPASTGAAFICSNGSLLFRSSIPTATWSAGPYLNTNATYPGLFTHRVATNGAVPSDNYETFVKATSYSANKVCTNFSTKVVKLRTATSKAFLPNAITAPANILVNQVTAVSVVLPATLTTSNTKLLQWNSSSTADMTVVPSTNLSTTVTALKVPTVSPKLYFTAVENSTGCGFSAWRALTVTAAQSIVDANNDVNTTIGVNVYPNPSNGHFTIENTDGATSIKLIDIAGRVIATQPITSGTAIVDFSGVATGKYMVHVSGETINKVQPIVIE